MKSALPLFSHEPGRKFVIGICIPDQDAAAAPALEFVNSTSGHSGFMAFFADLLQIFMRKCSTTFATQVCAKPTSRHLFPLVNIIDDRLDPNHEPCQHPTQ